MQLNLKPISSAAIPEAVAKIELYRYLSEPGEAESICRDILAIDPENQAALRLLGLAITDQFNGSPSDRYEEAEAVFSQLTNEYERTYFCGILYERKAKAQLRFGRPPRTILPVFEKAMKYFEDAERISPPKNDEAILRWNRCVRILQSRTGSDWLKQEEDFDASEGPPPYQTSSRE